MNRKPDIVNGVCLCALRAVWGDIYYCDLGEKHPTDGIHAASDGTGTRWWGDERAMEVDLKGREVKP